MLLYYFALSTVYCKLLCSTFVVLPRICGTLKIGLPMVCWTSCYSCPELDLGLHHARETDHLAGQHQGADLLLVLEIELQG